MIKLEELQVKRHIDSSSKLSEKFHPTQKPLPLIEWCLEFFPEAKKVIDPFLGSGTTAIACQNLKRNWIGIEISPEYCEVARNRLYGELFKENI